MGHVGSDWWALMTWLVEEGRTVEMVLCLALVLGRLAMCSTEIRDTREGTDM